MLHLPDDPPEVDITPWLGVYERASVVIEIVQEDGAPFFKSTMRGELAELEDNPVEKMRLVPVREGLFGAHVADMGVDAPVWFYQLPTGERYVHFGGRATRKVA
jgi:hypothetical protein